ncbi:alpha/beta hydrolase [Catenulispora rubra]|uniref:alpha/beta hydrolase n=1 Tax=Catenulispora rubra TaxID=280293 RepID=UPI0018927989|nr:alpha/beta fold hydrolase [Catenulispora rubra]
MNRIPVVLIHGVWLHMSSWEGWTERFAAHGYDVHVPSRPGEPDAVAQARSHPGPLGGFGIDELTAHYEKAVRALDSRPVVIGHSAGGLIAQQLLDAGLARAAVAIAPLPVAGETTTAGSVSADRTGEQHQDYIPLPQPQFRQTIANTVGEQEAATLFTRFVVPAPRRLLTDLGLDGSPPHSIIDPGNTARGPLLLISGQEDRMVADAAVRATYKLYGDSTAVTDLKQFADRGHSLVIDSGWPAVADHVLAWLADHVSDF